MGDRANTVGGGLISSSSNNQLTSSEKRNTPMKNVSENWGSLMVDIGGRWRNKDAKYNGYVQLGRSVKYINKTSTICKH